MSDFTRKEWEKYERILDVYENHPGLYRLKLFFLFFQSFFGILLLVAVIFLLVRFAAIKPASRISVRIWIFLGISVGISLWGYLLAALNRPWKGLYLLRRKQYPNFYRKVNWISRKVKGPKIHAIYLTHEMNAAVSSSFVWIPFLRRNVLMVGYPLLCALSRRAFLGCLAHEIGHLSRKHLSIGAFFLLDSCVLDEPASGYFFAAVYALAEVLYAGARKDGPAAVPAQRGGGGPFQRGKFRCGIRGGLPGRTPAEIGFVRPRRFAECSDENAEGRVGKFECFRISAG